MKLATGVVALWDQGSHGEQRNGCQTSLLRVYGVYKYRRHNKL